MTSRRGLLRRLSALTGAAGLSGCSSLLARQAESPTGDLDPNPRADDLPIRQHAWNERLRSDGAGNDLLPRHLRLSCSTLMPPRRICRGDRRASDADAGGRLRVLRAAPDMLGWGTSYFDTYGSLDSSPIRSPRVLSRTDDPDLRLRRDARPCERRSVEPRRRRVGDVRHAAEACGCGGAGSTRRRVLCRRPPRRVRRRRASSGPRRRGRRPRRYPRGVAAVHGVQAGRAGNQATEEYVTIDEGPFAGATTKHVANIRQRLSDWWEPPSPTASSDCSRRRI